MASVLLRFAAALTAARACSAARAADSRSSGGTSKSGGNGSTWRKGIVFGCDEWTSVDAPCGGDASLASLRALAYTGADHVRIVWTWYQDTVNSTVVHPILAPSPLASASLDAVANVTLAAKALGLRVLWAPTLDPSWDNPANARSPLNPLPGAKLASRAQIGAGFTEEAEWQAWFASYAAYVLPAAARGAVAGADLFEVANGLDSAFRLRASDWRALIAQAKKAFQGGPVLVTAGASALGNVTFWDVVDAVGVDATDTSLAAATGDAALPLGQAPTVPALVDAWAPVIDTLAAVHAATKLPVLFTQAGYQSRPSCHLRPAGTRDRDPDDDSAWLEDHDVACQANACVSSISCFYAPLFSQRPQLLVWEAFWCAAVLFVCICLDASLASFADGTRTLQGFPR
jgi:hypothetical protein